MTRNVPSQMASHLGQSGTTTCRLLKIKTRADIVFGITNLDAARYYDDGSADGQVLYVAANGFDPAALRADLGLSVDNSEVQGLLSDEVAGITEEMVNAGDLDHAQWWCYLVNFTDVVPGTTDVLVSGRHIEIGSGFTGEIRPRNGIAVITELLDRMVVLKQPVGEVTSRKCRAIFGTPATPENRQRGCGVDITGLWVHGEVQAVGVEADRIFVADVFLGSEAIIPVPGRVQFLTGANAGREYAVESIDSGSRVELVETTAYPIEVGDTYRIRPHCGLRYLEDCIAVWNNGINFKGEPYIPDGSDVSAPK